MLPEIVVSNRKNGKYKEKSEGQFGFGEPSRALELKVVIASSLGTGTMRDVLFARPAHDDIQHRRD